MKKVLSFLIILTSVLLIPQKTFASSNFSTDYNATYNIDKNANSHVVLNASLKNLTDKYYASSYSIQVGFTDIINLVVSDEDGPITPKVVSFGNGSTITITFNRQVVGLNNKLNFTIAFDTGQIAENLNNVWDVNIPGISSQNDFSTFNVTVNYPSNLGAPTYIKPFIHNAYQSPGRMFFTKNDLGGSGISIAFGLFQVYNYDLKYHLQNNNLFPISTEIALPPSTNYQDVTIDEINPKPKNVRIDEDGNWLANYVLNSSQKVNIVVKGKIKVNLNPKKEELSSENAKKYLKGNQYWDTSDPKITELAKNLKTPYAIYQYVLKTLHYDFSRVDTNSPRLGASKVLSEPNSAVCLEFTDLFIAIARAAGIPAREIDGYAYSTNASQRPLSLVKDILHAWPEYYDFDKKSWIMVDPTWGNTTGNIDYFNVLDFDHITFVTKGLNSDYPVPAGGYKISANQNTKDVSINIGNNFQTLEPKVKLTLDIPDQLSGGIPISGEVEIKNLSNTIIPKSEIIISSNFLNPKKQTYQIQQIPPYGSINAPINFDKTSFLTNSKDTIKITLGESSIYKNVVIFPFFVNKLFLLGGLFIVSIIIVISAVAYISRSLFIQRQKQQNNLRWESNKPKK